MGPRSSTQHGTRPDVIVIPRNARHGLRPDRVRRTPGRAVHRARHAAARPGRQRPQGEKYGIERECEDIEAIRGQTGARLIFRAQLRRTHGPAGGARSAAFDAIATYEPGISVRGSIPVDWVGRARREVSRVRTSRRFITFLAGVNPDVTGRVPRPLLRAMLRRTIPPAELRQKLTLMPRRAASTTRPGASATSFATTTRSPRPPWS